MKRYPDWPRRLNAFLQTSAGQEFAWGQNDCALFACAAIAAQTGVDPASPLRGTYNTRAGALRAVLPDGGFEQLVDRVTAEHQMPELRSTRLAQRGDLVLFDSQDGPALGIVGFSGLHALSTAPQGIKEVPLGAWRRAWRVG